MQLGIARMILASSIAKYRAQTQSSWLLALTSSVKSEILLLLVIFTSDLKNISSQHMQSSMRQIVFSKMATKDLPFHMYLL